MTPRNFQHLANFIWSVADLLRGPYRPPRPPAEIDAELAAVEKRIMGLLREVTE